MADEQNQLSFSQRMGLVPAIKLAQVDGIDKPLQNSLWNVLTTVCFSGFSSRDRTYRDRLRGSNFHDFANATYSDFYKTTIDTLPQNWSTFKSSIKESFFKMSWHRAYSFLEFIVGLNHRGTSESLIEEFNKVLERENSAYRFVSGMVTPITSSNEIEEV